MNWLHLIACFFGGALLTNAVPHCVAGLQGRAFQTPFATPPGKGLSSSTINVIWGFFNVVAGYLLLALVGHFDMHAAPDLIAAVIGAFMISLYAARHFGQFHGGDLRKGL